MSNPSPRDIVVYISVLNWNKAPATLECIDYLLNQRLPGYIKAALFVVDNGSAEADWQQLATAANPKPVSLLRQPNNLGFAGGHNLIMRQAIQDRADYVWLVNNDGEALPDTLAQLVALAETEPQCGAVSPVIVGLHDSNSVEFCGATHNWQALLTEYCANEADWRRVSTAAPQDTWLVGAAPLFRVAALADIGVLNEAMFAYYEDNDISVRLVRAGWQNQVDFAAQFKHEIPNQRPPYFYYLMIRNAFLFWHQATPQPHRKLLPLRLLERAVFTANKLQHDGQPRAKVDACLLGGLDGWLGKTGKPELDRKVPWFMVLLGKLCWPYHRRHIRNHYAD